MSDKVLSLLGLMQRAHRITYGYDTVIKGLKEKKIELVIFTSDISEHSKNDVIRIAEDLNIEYLIINYTKEDIYQAIRKYSGIIGITDLGFSNKIKTLLEAHTSKEDI